MRTVLLDIEANGLEAHKLTDLTMVVTKEAGTDKVFVWGSQEVGEIWAALKDSGAALYMGGLDKLKDYLEDQETERVVAHNGIRYDFVALRSVLGMKLDGFNKPGQPAVFDTLLASQLLMPNAAELDAKAKRIPAQYYGRHSIAAWGQRFGLYKGEYKGPWDRPSEEMLTYCIRDVEILDKVYHFLIKHKRWVQAAIAIEHQFAEIIARQERVGVCVDMAAIDSAVSKLRVREAEIREELQQVFPPRVETMKTPAYWVWETGHVELGTYVRREAPTKKALVEKLRAEDRKWHRGTATPGPFKTKTIPFNPGSRQEIAARLFEKYGWKPKQVTETGLPQVDEGALSKLEYPEAKLLVEYFRVEKTLGQIADGKQSWLKFVGEDGRIHGRVNTIGARTTRCSHSSPNLAQVPSVGNFYGEECRSCFIPTPGRVLVGADASGLEARMLANGCHPYDGGEYEQIILHGDVHTENAKAFFGVEEVTTELRNQSKPGYYALIYGAGDNKMASLLGKRRAEAKKTIEGFYKRFPQIRQLIDAMQELTDTIGFVRSLDGRWIYSPNRAAALNSRLQADGAVVMKYALVRAWIVLHEMGLEAGRDFEFVLNIHDEAQAEVEPQHADTVGRVFVEAIAWAGKHLGVITPLAGEYKIGRNWKETH